MTQPLPPGAFAKALHEKRRSSQRRRWVVWGSVGAAVLVVAALVYLFLFSPVFAARKVEVNGAGLLTEQQVTDAAQVNLGVPLLREDTEAIAARVRSLAPVKEVAVSWALPDTIVINVTERRASYQVKQDGDYAWVDSDGVAFFTTPTPAADVVQVEAPKADERLRRDIATVVDELPEQLRGDIEQFSAKAVDRITFTLKGGKQVMWGSAEDSALKAEVIGALLSVDAKVYDVSAPRNPITKK